MCSVRRTTRIRRQRWVVGKYTRACLQIPGDCLDRTKTETHDGRKHRETSCSTERTHTEEEGRGRRGRRQTEDITNRIKSRDFSHCSADKSTDHECCKTHTRDCHRVQRNCSCWGVRQPHQTSTYSELGREASAWTEHYEHIYTCSGTRS